MCLMLQPTFSSPRDARAVRRYRAHAGELDWSRGENLLPIDIIEVISDQLAGNDANKLPTSFFGGNPSKPGNGHPNNPMLMATRTGQKAKLRLKMGSTNPSIYVGARKLETKKILGSSSANSQMINLEFDVPSNSRDKYEVVAGYDANSNSKLDDDEALVVFEKTPRKDREGNKSTTNLHLLDKIIIVDSGQYSDSRSETLSYGSLPFSGFAGDLLTAFANGTGVAGTTIDSGPVQLDASVIPSSQGLSHPLGAKWDNTFKSSTQRVIFPEGSSAATEVAITNGFRQIVIDVIRENMGSLVTSAGGSSGTVENNFPINVTDKSVNFADTDPFSLPHIAVGKGRFYGELILRYQVVNENKIYVIQADCVNGTCDDLYDFAYGAPPVSIMGFVVADPKHPAIVQAGHASLTSSSNANAGKVFFTRINFEATNVLSHEEVGGP